METEKDIRENVKELGKGNDKMSLFLYVCSNTGGFMRRIVKSNEFILEQSQRVFSDRDLCIANAKDVYENKYRPDTEIVQVNYDDLLY